MYINITVISVMAHNLNAVLHIQMAQYVSVVIYSTAGKQKPHNTSFPSTNDVIFDR